MHQSSYTLMQQLVFKYLDSRSKLYILDVGSGDVNGTYKDIFSCVTVWNYVGLDLEPLDNVDVVATDFFKWPFEDNTFNIVVSGQCLEHVPMPWLWIKEIVRILKRNGICIIIAPWSVGLHRFPMDCWRIMPDGMSVLLGEWAGMDVIEVGMNPIGKELPIGDCWGVAIKKLIGRKDEKRQ